MNNADLSALSAILRNPFPVEKSLTDIAGIVMGLLQTVDSLNAGVAKLDRTVETLIEEQIEVLP